VKSGSEITLNCKLQQGPHDLGTIYWYKGEFTIIFAHPTYLQHHKLNLIGMLSVHVNLNQHKLNLRKSNFPEN
jgi:hypothetical protein